MDDIQNLSNLCRVCLNQAEEHENGSQMITLNVHQIEKLIYIGDSSEVVRLNNQPPLLCTHCESKLDSVYDFVYQFNFSKLKLRGYVEQYIGKEVISASAYDPYRIVDVNLDTDDRTENLATQQSEEELQTEYFIQIIKMESSPPPSPYESRFENDEFQEELQIQPAPESVSIYHTNPQFNIKVEPNPSPIPTIGPKPKKRKLQCENRLTVKSKSKLMKPKGIGKLKSKKDIEIKSEFDLKAESSQQGCDNPSSPEHNVCHLCGKVFSTRANMLRHVREHLGRRFVCHYENCNSFFTQRSSLQVHIASHEGLKPHACDICGKRFSQSKSLVFHLRVHTGESPFSCDYCNAAFKQKSNLIRHFKSHNKPQPPRLKRFKCPRCTKMLASKQSLLRHEIRHNRADEQITMMGAEEQITMMEAIKIEKNLFN